MVDSAVALIVFLLAAVVLYFLFKFINISTGAAVALALFFALIIMAFVKTPMSVYNSWGQDGAAQIYAILAFIATLYIIIWFLWSAFSSRDVNAPYRFRAW